MSDYSNSKQQVSSGVGGFNDIFHSALDMNLKTQMYKIFSNLHPADQADIVYSLTKSDRKKLVEMLSDKLDPELLISLHGDVRSEIIGYLNDDVLVQLVAKLDSDDAVALLDSLEDKLSQQTIDALSSNEQKEDIKEQLAYPKNSVGRIMDQNHYIAISKNWDVEEFYKFIKKNKNIPEGVIDIIVVDEYFRPVSTVSITTILKADIKAKISDIMKHSEDLRIISANMEQKKAAKLFVKYDLDYMPVIDDNGVLIGVINSNDIMYVINDESTKYMMLISRSNKDNQSISMSPWKISITRIPWLCLSFFSGIIDTFVVDMFSDTIDRVIVLAALLNLVSNLSSVSSTQTLSVIIKDIANGNSDNINSIKLIFKQVLVGMINGFFLSVIIFVFIFIWKDSLSLSLVCMLSVFLLQIFASFLGSFIPLIFNKLKLDSAITSSAFLTILDSISSFILLGLATVFLLK